MNIYEKLLAIQSELKAPKNQYNSYGKYKYRNCEDILEAVKPLCTKYKAVLTLNDDVDFMEGRHYVVAIATLYNVEAPEEVVSTHAFAKEEDTKKGMDAAQITGATSSYARKYALNALFCIDDTKDADATSDNDQKEEPKEEDKPKASNKNADSKKFIMCGDCGKPIVDIVVGGKEWGRKVIAENTMKTYGKSLCWECACKAKESKQRTEQERLVNEATDPNG